MTTVVASDADLPAQTLTFSISGGADQALFSIDANTGEVTVAGGIDREAASSYDLTVRATSTDTSFSTAAYVISVTDVDEFDVGAIGPGPTTIRFENCTGF